MKIRCAIFDLDGTLVDSMPFWEQIPIDYLISKGVKPEEEIPEVFLAMSLEASAVYFKEHFGIADSIEEIEKSIDDMIEEAYMTSVKLKPGIGDLLKEFDSLGIKMAVASATDKYLIEAVDKKLGIDRYFPYILTSGEVGSSKQNPDIYIKSAEHYGFKPQESMIFEDLPYGIISSKKVGFTTVGLYDETSKKLQTIIKENADFYIENLDKSAIKMLVNFAKTGEE